MSEAVMFGRLLRTALLGKARASFAVSSAVAASIAIAGCAMPQGVCTRLADGARFDVRGVEDMEGGFSHWIAYDRNGIRFDITAAESHLWECSESAR